MSITVEKTMEIYLEELRQYQCSHRFAGGMVMHMTPVGDSGFWIGTLTAYDRNGMKSESAVPFNQYIKIVNEVEDLLSPYQTRGFNGKLVGWNPSQTVKSFLYNKKVHRLFFLEEQHVLPFIKSYTKPVRVQKRKEEAVEVVVMVG